VKPLPALILLNPPDPAERHLRNTKDAKACFVLAVYYADTLLDKNSEPSDVGSRYQILNCQS
jgi:hypothetical protein